VTLAAQLAIAHAPERAGDLWSPDDLDVVCHNLLESARGGRAFRAWHVDRGDPTRRWLVT
jgi:hypothetical protein